MNVAAVTARGEVPLIVSIHSFTPVWRGWPRPWHVGILWDRDAAVATAMIRGFQAQAGLVVGDNEPYHGALEGDTLNTHGTRPGLPHALKIFRFMKSNRPLINMRNKGVIVGTGIMHRD